MIDELLADTLHADMVFDDDLGSMDAHGDVIAEQKLTRWALRPGRFVTLKT